MTKDEMKAGFGRGRRLMQEEWASAAEIAAVDELITEGYATTSGWHYSGNHQCEVRTIVGANR